MNKVEEQLIQLRDLTRRMGVLHEGQALQLRMWLLVSAGSDFFKDYEIDYNFPSKVVTFKLIKADMKKAPSNLDKRFQALADNVGWLLGEDHSIKVKAGRKVIFKGLPSLLPDEKVNVE